MVHHKISKNTSNSLFDSIKVVPQMFKFKHYQTTLEDLPFPFIPGSSNYFNNLQFYWDSYFIMLGLMYEDEEAKLLAKGMIENFHYLFKKFNFIPNSYPRDTTRTQPPLLTSMILLIHKHFNDKNWLEEMYQFAKAEYFEVWMREPRLITDIGLSRYFDPIHPLGIHQNAEDESGWDFTPRFEEKCDECIAIDLNSLLYKYENDLQHIAEYLNFHKDMKFFIIQKANRKKLIDFYLYNSEDKLFYDYNFKEKKQLQIKTLATFFPLFANLATFKQAQNIVDQLYLFEHKYGLVTCDSIYGYHNKQWNYPNGWAPLQYIVIQGLKNYGFFEEAQRISLKWLSLNSQNYFQSGGNWEEKYVVIDNKLLQKENLKRIDDSRYEHQNKLFWSKGVFISLYKELEEDISKKLSKITSSPIKRRSFPFF